MQVLPFSNSFLARLAKNTDYFIGYKQLLRTPREVLCRAIASGELSLKIVRVQATAYIWESFKNIYSLILRVSERELTFEYIFVEFFTISFRPFDVSL